MECIGDVHINYIMQQSLAGTLTATLPGTADADSVAKVKSLELWLSDMQLSYVFFHGCRMTCQSLEKENF